MIRTVLLSAAVAATMTVMSAPQANAGSIPSSLPQTRALDADLARLSAEVRDAANRLQQLRREVQSARRDVQRAGQVVKSLDRMDQRLTTLIRRLHPYRYVPQVRTAVKVLLNNLSYLQKSIHNVRVKADQANSKVIQPLASRLRKFETQLKKPIDTLAMLAVTTNQARTKLAQAAAVAQSQSYARRTLEDSARQIRPTVTSLVRTASQVNAEAGSVQRKLNSFSRSLASFATMQRSLSEMDRDLAPGEKVARDLDNVLSKRLTIKLPIPPFKRVGFSVRDILEKPGKVIDIVLKPLEKLANKLLQPVIKKLHLRIKTPAGLDSLSRTLNQLPATANSLQRDLARYESRMQGQLNQQVSEFQRIVQQKLRR